MHVVAEEHWSWMLFAHGDRRFLSVLCGTVGLYTIDIELDEPEKTRLNLEGTSFVKWLEQQIHARPEHFLTRHIRDFDSLEGSNAAALKWRAEHDTPEG